MKKITVFLFLFFICGAVVFSQNLQDNEYYQKSLEFASLSEQAFEKGDYGAARDHALKAQEYAALSRDYMNEMLAAYKARSALNAANARIGVADRYNLKVRNSSLYISVTVLFKQAQDEFAEKEYTKCLDDAQEVLALLKDLEAEMGAGVPADKAAIYRVKRDDSLWRIADLDFIYGDRTQWGPIYEANKSRFHDPENPHLIFAGQILNIPSLAGEARSGER